MTWRKATSGDIPAIRAIWEVARYGFDFPEIEGEKIISSWIAEEEGRIVCWSGAQLHPEIILILDQNYASPHERMRLVGQAHIHVARDCREHGHEKAFANVDPQYPSFARHLVKARWWHGWKMLWVKAETILGKKKP